MYTKTLTLANGVKIPQLGLGTWFIDDANAAEAVRAAVKLGYRHVDTAQGIAVEAYSPIAHGVILHQPELEAMAKRYGVSVPQLCIRYTLQLGAISLPKTANPAHMESNAQVDFEISEADMESLKHFKRIESYGESGVFPVYGGRL